MTNRQLDREIFRLAVPALGALAADPLVSLVDTAFVGRLGKVPLGALGVSVAVFSIAFFMFNFLAYGTTPLIAGAVADGEHEVAGRLTAGALALGLAIGLATTAILLIFADPVLRIMGAKSDLLADATLYLRIRVLGMPAVLVATVAHGVFRGYQDTKTPMWVTGSIAIFNLILDPVLIFGLGWGLAGAAWATTIAQWIGAGTFIALFYLRRNLFRLTKQWPGFDSLRPLVGAGRALIVRSGSLLAAFTLATAVATRQGDEVVAAHQVAVQLWIFLALVVDALAIAGQALVGLHLAKDHVLARSYADRLLRWGVVGGLVLAVVMALGWSVLPALFTNDADVLQQVKDVYIFIVVMQPLNAIVFVWDGLAIGASQFVFLAASTVASAIATAVVLGAVQLQDWGLSGVWWALVAMMLVRFVTLAWWHVNGPLSPGRDPSLESPGVG
ncbi:MAG: MATE family efflux transporter [bacterium]|nr:MATE family efflux transporter [bacterium]MCP4965118.1 MATE family efflux transporter [bacterium]